MNFTTAIIGFGEAGEAFSRRGMIAYDSKFEDPSAGPSKLADCKRAGVIAAESAAEALRDADAVLSLVTADQALAVARNDAPALRPEAMWLDMNSVAPVTKREAAAVVEAAGGAYVDVAVMSPVLPSRQATPLLLAGPHADAGAALLRDIGFTDIAIVGHKLGDASAIKMIRSVMVKGIEALSAECALAAERAGVLDAVLSSLDASWAERGWADRIDYSLHRMLVHGTRRGAEMEEAARTLADLGVDAAMTRGTIRRQREIGELGIAPPPGLPAKLAAIGGNGRGRCA